MAIVQYTAAVNQLRGKLNGSVFNRARTSFTLQRKQSQTKGAKGYQGRARQHFQRAQREWKQTTSSQKGSWQQTANNNPALDRFGQQVILSGYNQFIKANIQRFTIGLPVVLTGYTFAAPATDLVFDVTDAAYTVNPSNGQVSIAMVWAYDPPQVGSEFGVFLEVGLPYSNGVTRYQGRYIFVYGTNALAGSSLSFTAQLPSTYGIPIAEQKVNFRYKVVHLPSGATVAEGVLVSEVALA